MKAPSTAATVEQVSVLWMMDLDLAQILLQVAMTHQPRISLKLPKYLLPLLKTTMNQWHLHSFLALKAPAHLPTTVPFNIVVVRSMDMDKWQNSIAVLLSQTQLLPTIQVWTTQNYYKHIKITNFCLHAIKFILYVAIIIGLVVPSCFFFAFNNPSIYYRHL